MNHIAIDLGGMKSQVCVRGPDGELKLEGKRDTRDLDLFLQKQPKSRVIVESSAEAFKVADAALAAGHEVRVVPSTLSKVLGVGARRTKTDERDARALSEMSCRMEVLPAVHIPSARTRELRSTCTAREALVSARTQLVNSVRGYCRTQLVRLPAGRTETFPQRVRKMLGMRKEGVPSIMERLLLAIEALNTQIAAADEELEQIAQQDATCRRLMTMPGVGPVTAVRYMAAADKIDRFEDAHKMEAYLGLTPGENSSSERQQRTGITKAGPARVRWTLVQAAWCLWRTRPQDRNVLWAVGVAQRRGNRVAIVALARKLAGILFAMWRDGTDYDSHHTPMTRQA